MTTFRLKKIIFIVIIGTMATPAFAYVDPGTGAMVVQAFLALFAAAIFYLRNPKQLWRDLKTWLKNRRQDS